MCGEKVDLHGTKSIHLLVNMHNRSRFCAMLKYKDAWPLQSLNSRRIVLDRSKNGPHPSPPDCTKKTVAAVVTIFFTKTKKSNSSDSPATHNSINGC